MVGVSSLVPFNSIHEADKGKIQHEGKGIKQEADNIYLENEVFVTFKNVPNVEFQPVHVTPQRYRVITPARVWGITAKRRD